VEVSGLPTNGSNIYIRFWSNRSGEWLLKEYTLTTVNGGG